MKLKRLFCGKQIVNKERRVQMFFLYVTVEPFVQMQVPIVQIHSVVAFVQM